MKKISILVLVISVFLISAYISYADVCDVLEVGQSKTVSLNNVQYEVTAMVFSGDSSTNAVVKFIVNNEVTTSLSIGKSFDFKNGINIYFRDVSIQYSDNTLKAKIDFCLKTPSCSDSDGGHQIYTAGIAKGYANNIFYKGNFISGNQALEDYCYTVNKYSTVTAGSQGDHLKEYSCYEGGITFGDAECNCVNGACVKQLCSDSDGGIDYYVYGETSNGDGTGSADTCVDTDPGLLQENYCANNVRQLTNYRCPNGCANGACIKSKCKDSDNGKDYFTKGTTCQGDLCEIDFCLDSTKLFEMDCGPNGDQKYGYHYSCPNGCKDGACLQQNYCLDSDGLNFYTYGEVKFQNQWRNDVFKDYCEGTIAYDYICDSTGIYSLKSSECQNGCKDGACIKGQVKCDGASVTDTLEIGFEKTYYINGKKYEFTVMVVSGDNADNFVTKIIVNDEVSKSLKIGDKFTLADGAVIKIKDIMITKSSDIVKNLVEFCIYAAPTETKCTDSDGGRNQNVKGTTSGKSVYPDEGYTTKTDYCIQKKSTNEFKLDYSVRDPYSAGKIDYCGQNCAVAEYYCSDATIVADVINCPYGCSNGACTKPISTGSSWIHNMQDSSRTCSEICSSLGSSVSNSCYDKNLDKCTVAYGTVCGDGNANTVVNKDYSTACCCGTSIVNGCFSSDGSNPFKKGTTTVAGGSIYTDYCNGNYIIDYFCSEDGSATSINDMLCPNGCSDGACVNTQLVNSCTFPAGFDCTDFDYDKTTNQLQILIKNNMGYDIKVNKISLDTGYSCNYQNAVDGPNIIHKNQQIYSYTFYCSPTGDAIKEKIKMSYTNVETGLEHVAQGSIYMKVDNNAKCTDSDGGLNYYSKGTVKYGKYDYTDSCANPGKALVMGKEVEFFEGDLLEYSCLGEGKDNRCTDTACRYTLYHCENGCSNGACIQEEQGYAYLNQKFELRQNQEVKFTDYKNMKVRLIGIISECKAYTTTSDTSTKSRGCNIIGANMQVEMPYVCEASSSAPCATGTGTDFFIKEGEKKEIFGVELSAVSLQRYSGTFLVSNKIESDLVDISIYPVTEEVYYGEKAVYKITIKDKHPKLACQEGTICSSPLYGYEIKVQNLPFNKDFEKKVYLQAGESKAVSLTVTPFMVESKAVSATIAKQVNSAPTVAAVTGQVVYAENVAVTTKQLQREYKFSVVVQAENGNARDEAFALLVVKPKVTPPPFPSEEVTIPLYKGWNLISLPGKLIQFVENNCNSNKKLLGFVFLKESQKYVTLKEAEKTLGDGFGEYLAKNSFWVYSYDDCELKAKIDPAISFSGLGLYQGWNLVPITEDMVGGYLRDILDDCDIQKLNKWNAKSQEWEKISLDYAFSDSDKKYGFIAKVTNYCSLGGVSILAPPAMPEEAVTQ